MRQRNKWNKDLRTMRKKEEHSDRRSAAVNAKAALLQAYRAAQLATTPTREARQAERKLIAEAREIRQAEREKAKRDEQNRIAAELAQREAAIAAAARAETEAQEEQQAAIAAAARAEAEAIAMADRNRITRVLEDEAARKAERDRRYANRKARRA